MSHILTPDKKVKTVLLNGPTERTLIQTDDALAITNILISKDFQEQLTIFADNLPIFFVKGAGLHQVALNGGLILWRGASLIAKTKSKGQTLIFIDYIDIHGQHASTWS